jgi:hypothetical protein
LKKRKKILFLLSPFLGCIILILVLIFSDKTIKSFFYEKTWANIVSQKYLSQYVYNKKYYGTRIYASFSINYSYTLNNLEYNGMAVVSQIVTSLESEKKYLKDKIFIYYNKNEPSISFPQPGYYPERILLILASLILIIAPTIVLVANRNK